MTHAGLSLAVLQERIRLHHILQTIQAEHESGGSVEKLQETMGAANLAIAVPLLIGRYLLDSAHLRFHLWGSYLAVSGANTPFD